MERVTVRTYLETLDVKRYGAHYERPNGERIEITSGELGPESAKDKAAARLYKCEWEQFRASRQDGFFEIGHGWIDEPDRNVCTIRRRLASTVERANHEVVAAQQEGISGKLTASVPSFLNARNAELKAVSELDKHRKEHGCWVIGFGCRAVRKRRAAASTRRGIAQSGPHRCIEPTGLAFLDRFGWAPNDGTVSRKWATKPRLVSQ